jgi:hypothetical protein
MSVIETVLIYGVIPLAVFLAFAAATLLPGRGKERTSYRPGQPWTAKPVWYEPHPDARGVAGGHDADAHGDAHADGHSAPGLGATAAALTIGEHPHEPQSSDGPRRTAAGGARGTW